MSERAPGLRPCVFCGGQPLRTISNHGHHVECERRVDGCPMSAMTHHHPTPEAAALAWNQAAGHLQARAEAAEAEVAAMREALERIRDRGVAECDKHGAFKRAECAVCSMLDDATAALASTTAGADLLDEVQRLRAIEVSAEATIAGMDKALGGTGKVEAEVCRGCRQTWPDYAVRRRRGTGEFYCPLCVMPAPPALADEGSLEGDPFFDDD